MARKIIWSLFLVFLSGQVALAQATDIEQEITQLSQQKWQWIPNMGYATAPAHEKFFA